MSVRIRDECPGDAAALHQVIARAFADFAHSDQSEPAIVAQLRRDGDLALSLVAEDDGALVGHIAFSPVTVAGEPGNWMGLAPVSVLPECQGRGIGAALVREGLARLRASGIGGCVVLGDPAYYARFGFRREPALAYPGAPAEYFMAQALCDTLLPQGEVAYAAAFTA